jgi:hypothetical protein
MVLVRWPPGDPFDDQSRRPRWYLGYLQKIQVSTKGRVIGTGGCIVTRLSDSTNALSAVAACLARLQHSLEASLKVTPIRGRNIYRGDSAWQLFFNTQSPDRAAPQAASGVEPRKFFLGLDSPRCSVNCCLDAALSNQGRLRG